MIAQLITLLITNLFGRNLRSVSSSPPLPVPQSPSLPLPVEPIVGSHHTPPQDSTPPLLHSSTPPTAPNILIPDPAHADAHGPASAIARAMLRKGHVIFEKDHQPHNLNIVGIRATDPVFDKFNDRLVHFSKESGEWKMESWPITTLPGHRYMVDKLLSPLGCAILAPGQYRDIYRLDKHRGIYEALCQRGGDVRVFRDKDRDREFDLIASTIQTGSYGINIHCTENPDDGVSNPVLDRIGAASAGCQVFARVNDFIEARKRWRMARSLWGPGFTYTLLNAADLDDPGTVPLEPVTPQHSDPEKWSPPAPATTGTRNRNLLNVKQGADPWKYSTGKDSRGHTIFPTYASGIRAAIITLRTYWKTHRLRTLSGITGRWAPSSDTVGSLAGAPSNRPDLYATFLSMRLGIATTDTLMTFHEDGTIRSAEQLYQLVAAMVEMENGAHVKLPRSVFDAGLALV